MLKSLKIFLIILGLGVFILPGQLLSAQEIEQCCEQSTSENCCKNDAKKSCHSEKSGKNDHQSGCGKDCGNCQNCIISFVLNFYPAVNKMDAVPTIIGSAKIYPHKFPFFSSLFQNIWQPPKLA